MRIGQSNQPYAYPAASKGGGTSSLDFNDVMHYTRSRPAMSDEAYHSAIVEQAKKDFERGEFQNDSSGFNSLIKSYVSVVSPDRKGIISEGLKTIAKKPQSGPINLIELMLEKGSMKYHKTDNSLSYAEFYDSQGNMIANYSNGQWVELRTPDEAARQIEFCSIYNRAWGDAKRAVENVTPNNSGEGALDVLA